MCGHKYIGIWKISKITVVDSNDIVNHWLMTVLSTKPLSSTGILCFFKEQIAKEAFSTGFGLVRYPLKHTKSIPPRKVGKVLF